MALTTQQVTLVKSTVPVLRQHGNDITTFFYQSLLTAHPSLKNIFSLRDQHSGAQPRALAASVLAYAAHIDDLGALAPAVERIAQKHASLFIEPAMYDIVGEFLVAAFGKVLGDALTDDVKDAWIAAYGQLAGVFIKREEEIYQTPGHSRTWRKFRVVKREPESASVTSFYLAPSDGVVPLPKYKPGQYLSVRIPLPQLDGLMQTRQYSLSDAPSADQQLYRVSVKREFTEPNASRADIYAGKVPGVVSNILHDQYSVGTEIELSNPQGEFFVDPADTSKATTPIILLSAGVGATPIMSILSALVGPDSKTSSRPISWIGAGRDSANLCFRPRVRALSRENDNVRARIFVDAARSDDREGEEYDFAGALDFSVLDAEKELFLSDGRSEYYICGPTGWMLLARAQLQALGVAREKIHLELFGVGDAEDQ